MNLFWRLLRILLFSRFSSKINLFDQSKTFFRVWPTDLDALMHMNNGKYFSLMDLSRLDFMIRSQTWSVLKKHGLYPVLASSIMRYRRSLKLFQRFALTSRLVGWDDKYVYVEQLFLHNNEVYALSIVKTRFMRRSGGTIDPIELLHLMGVDKTSPELPQWIHDWQGADQTFHDAMIRDARSK